MLPTYLPSARAIEAYNAWAAFADVKSNSLQTYNACLKKFFAYLGERGIAFENVERADVKDFIFNFCANLAPSTRALHLQVLKNFWAFLGAKSPAHKIKFKETDKSFKKDFLDENKARALLFSVENSRDKAILYLMVCTGLRVSELHCANVTDLENTPDGDCILYVLGKARQGKTEYVKIPKGVENTLKQYLAGRKTGALFISESRRTRGNRLSCRAISRIAKDALKGIGLDSKRFTAHSLRHTAAVLNLKAGGTLTETMQLLRHKNIATTRNYTHAIENKLNPSSERIESFLMAA